MNRAHHYRTMLPGLDCGLCLQPDGCQGYARLLASGVPRLDLCLPGGESLKSKLAELRAESQSQQSERVAVINCQGSAAQSSDRFAYSGLRTCRGAMKLHGGPRQCLYGCLRFGDCLEACPHHALCLSAEGFPKVDFSRCQGCGRCVAACPKQLIQLGPKSQQIHLACFCQARSEGLFGGCPRGCTSCWTCQESCPYQAIGRNDSLPLIDHQRCRSCSICVYKCPRKSFLDRIPIRPTAFIGLQCNGCEKCKAVCPSRCITGKKGEHHKVARGQCIGCGQCFEICPLRAVTMLGALGHVDLSNF